MIKSYEKYKKTNIPWLEEVPSHWECKRVITIFSENKKKNFKLDSVNAFQFKMGELIAKKKHKMTDELAKIYSQYTLIQPHDIMVNGLNLNYDFVTQRVALVTGNGIVTSAYISLRPRSNTNSKYYTFLLKTLDAKKIFNGMGSGIRLTLDFSEFKKLNVPIPPLVEQDKIVKYLEWKASKINTLIKAKKKQIELLKEQKQAVINKAVTKGLDDSVPMKDSGIEWLGEVPEHWDVRKLRTLTKFQFQYGANESGVPYSKLEPRYIRITDIDSNGDLKNKEKISLPNTKAQQYILEDGDILFARSGATVGKTFIYKKEHGKAAFAGYLIRFKPNEEILLPQFIYDFTLGSGYNVWISYIFIQATIQNISAEKYKNLQIALPPINEQQAIVNYLEKEISNIDKAITLIDKEINLISEYKTSLIASVTTGRIDVRNVVIPEVDII